MRSVRSLAVAAAGLVVACVTVAPPDGSPAPRNTCSSDLDCSRYMQAGSAPACLSGVCEVTAEVTQWTAVVSLSESAAYAPGATFAVSYSDLIATQGSPTCASACPPNQRCVQLPPLATTGNVDVEVPQSAALIANWNLGNPGSTALPVTPILRPVVAAGIPLDPIVIHETLNSGADAVRGPGGGPSLEFSIAVPPGVYEQTLMPMAPFDQAFPPDIRTVNLITPPYPEQSVHLGCDPTPPGDPLCTKFDATASSMGMGAAYPTFEVTRDDKGPLDGWVAFLRDATTLRRISNQVPLQGTDAKGVQLLTSHHPASLNALENAALVLQPPTTSALPTLVVEAIGGSLPAAEAYPQLPQPVQVTGKVVSEPGGRPVPADVVFEATGVPTLPATGLCRVPTSSTAAKFDPSGDLTFTASVLAADGTFTVTLPQGVYRATARPRDTTNAVTVVPNFATVSVDGSGTCLDALQPGPIVVGHPQTVRGVAIVGDLRPLAAATVEAVPTGCSGSGSDAVCLPRSGQATTDDSGAYAITLDPGVYSLRVRPAEGSALPWVVSTLTVGSASATPGPNIVVPAPFYAGLLLQDYKCNPIVEGLVRMYETPATGSAFEIGEAVTDATGHYDMYLEPSPQ